MCETFRLVVIYVIHNYWPNVVIQEMNAAMKIRDSIPSSDMLTDPSSPTSDTSIDPTVFILTPLADDDTF